MPLCKTTSAQLGSKLYMQLQCIGSQWSGIVLTPVFRGDLTHIPIYTMQKGPGFADAKSTERILAYAEIKHYMFRRLRA